IADSTGAFAGGAFVCARPGGLLMGARDGAVDAGERQLRLSLCHHVGHDLVPHAAHRPAAKPQVGMVPIAQFSRDRPPFGTVVEPPDNRFNRAPILLAGPRATNLHRHNRRFELRPLGIRQDLHRLATPMPNKISRPVTSASHQLRTDPKLLWAGNHWRDQMSDIFSRAAHCAAQQCGRATVFMLAVALIIVWAATGPLFDYSDTWQL